MIKIYIYIYILFLHHNSARKGFIIAIIIRFFIQISLRVYSSSQVECCSTCSGGGSLLLKSNMTK